MRYSFHPLAKRELNDAVEHYNECRDDLGIEFIEEAPYPAIPSSMAALFKEHPPLSYE